MCIISNLLPTTKAKVQDKATKANEGEMWGVLWNEQDVRQLGVDPIYRKGIIKDVKEDGCFILEMGNATMVCQSLRHLKQYPQQSTL